MKDVSSEIVHKTAKLLSLCSLAGKKLEGYPRSKTERPDISGELLKMYVLADELLEYAEPMPSVGEIHGLPKEAVFDSKTSLKFSNDKGWDFRAWFMEKSLMVKKGVKELYKYWEKDPNEVKLIEGAPMTPIEWIGDGILSSLSRIKTYAQTIFEMTCNDEIVIEETNE